MYQAFQTSPSGSFSTRLIQLYLIYTCPPILSFQGYDRSATGEFFSYWKQAAPLTHAVAFRNMTLSYLKQ
jgi:hypothetical protein